MSFACKHLNGEHCILLDKPCDPGMKGCTLYGKFSFSDPASDSNKAYEKRKVNKESNAKQSS